MRPWIALALCCACAREFEGGGEADSDSDTDTDVASDGDSDTDTDTGPAPCGSGNRPLPDGLTALQRDDGESDWNVHGTTWEYPAGVSIPAQALWEATRFDLPHPARIHGFSVSWSNLPIAAADSELEAGLYGDFGYNGFDFWRGEALWTGTRCLEDAAGGAWVDYVFETPIDVAQPGLAYVAHPKGAGTEDAVFAMDHSYRGEGDCAAWNDCGSALNLPEADPDSTYDGVSFPIPYDYLVRLHVEYTDEATADEMAFEAVGDVAFGGRVSWGDYDRDGWDDALSGAQLWRNGGDGAFENVTGAAGLDGDGGGGVWGDYDNDGCLDLFVFHEGAAGVDRLWHGECDGTFADATAASGIEDIQDDVNCDDALDPERSPTHAAAWFDVDADGLVDLYMANYECDFDYYRDKVWHNDGGGVFSDWSGTSGFSNVRYASRGASPIDYEQDGDVDLLVNSYRLQPNVFYENRGGSVVERAAALGLAGVDEWGAFGHTIATAWGDLDGDADFDSVHANLAHPRYFHFSDKTQVLLQQADGAFEDTTGTWTDPGSSGSGLRYQETHSVPLLADFDQDGALDLVVSAVYPGRPTDFYWGAGDGTFVLDSYRSGITTTNGWGMAASDYDHDGDVDFALYDLWENRLGAEGGHWLAVQAIGDVDSNRAALGATVRVVAGGRTFVRHVAGGSGQGCQDSLSLHFGLGDALEVDRIEVDFPGGGTVRYEGPFGVDRKIWAMESGTTEEGW